MGKVINLNKARKRKQADADKKLAAENRIRYGRSKDEKQREESAVKEAVRRLNLLKREAPPEKLP